MKKWRWSRWWHFRKTVNRMSWTVWHIFYCMNSGKKNIFFPPIYFRNWAWDRTHTCFIHKNILSWFRWWWVCCLCCLQFNGFYFTKSMIFFYWIAVFFVCVFNRFVRDFQIFSISMTFVDRHKVNGCLLKILLFPA